MIVKSWREAFSTTMRDSGDSWEMVEWKSMSATLTTVPFPAT